MDEEHNDPRDPDATTRVARRREDVRRGAARRGGSRAVADDPVIRLGVSACLLGEEVRFDGGHKRDAFLVRTLGRFVTWVPVCPEVAVGMGTPRESVRLVKHGDDSRMVGLQSGRDWTETMASWASAHVEELGRARLHGFVLKKDSPSCGVFRVKRWPAKGGPGTRDGRGLFAAELVARLRLLPVEEEGRLQDMRLRENFIERVFAYERWLRLLDEDPSPEGLARFHAAHELTVLSHDPAAWARLGRIVARAGRISWTDASRRYGELLLETLAVVATRGRHAAAMRRLTRLVADGMTAGDRRELAAAIADYRAEHVPLVVPLTLLRHHLRVRGAPEWAASQVYLSPYPKELMLRNHV
jgi:uncharacterized protein YbbK (DUF523 family)/uncharacterized protein YbgA (DUF1722 family)